MPLHALAGGDPQRAVGQLAGEVVHGQVLLGGEHPAGDGGPDHADVVEAGLGPGPLAAHVPVVLLVDAVELQHDLVVVVEAVAGIGQFAGDRPPQLAAAVLDGLDLGQGHLRGGLGHVAPPPASAGCRPHSVLTMPAHRPARACSPGANGRVQGQHPIEREALAGQRVAGKVALGHVGLDVAVGPGGQRVHLDESSTGVPLDDGRARPGRRLVPAQPAHPGRALGEGPVEGLHLAHGAAAVQVVAPAVVRGSTRGGRR